MQHKVDHHIRNSVYPFTFGPNPPVLSIRSGEVIAADTVDALGYNREGQPLAVHQKPSTEATRYQEANPLAGPVWVEGADPGDALRVTILEIELDRGYAWSLVESHFGSLKEESEGRELLFNPPCPDQYYRWELDRDQGTATLDLKQSRRRRVTIPLHPFLGAIGVAPRFGRVETALVPGEYGGNMDCVETGVGARLLLPVWVRGAYLAFGDVHAAQGDGEICGSALETTGRVVVRVEVVKAGAGEWPRIETDEYLMVAGSDRPLMAAFRIAHLELVKWMVEEYGFDKWEAVQVLSQVGTARVGNVVDPRYTVVAKIPRFCVE
jgi:acetamidase/formamidase